MRATDYLNNLMKDPDFIQTSGRHNDRCEGAGRSLSRLAARLVYWLIAHSYFLPGLYLQRYSTQFGLSLAAKRRTGLPRSVIYRLLSGTLESTTYFEFDFAWRSLFSAEKGHEYLDVLSPWILPLLILQRRKITKATVANSNLNPAFQDLLRAANLGSQCRIITGPLEDSPLKPESFDIITSMSGLASVRDESRLISTLWSLLKPGGRIVVSLPCAMKTTHPVISHEDRDGRTSYVLDIPRRYDPRLIEERVFSRLGEPESMVIYGESGRPSRDLIRHNLTAPDGPTPREPVLMAHEWRCFSRMEDLPGSGVIAMVFRKQLVS